MRGILLVLEKEKTMSKKSTKVAVDIAKVAGIAVVAVVAAEATGVMDKVRSLFGRARTAIGV